MSWAGKIRLETTETHLQAPVICAFEHLDFQVTGWETFQDSWSSTHRWRQRRVRLGR